MQPLTSPEQPWLHELSVCVNGNVTALSDRAGDISGRGAEGVYVDDRRILSRLEVDLAGSQIVPVAHASSGAQSEFTGCARQLGNPGADPTVEVHRQRQVVAMGITERITVVSRADAAVHTELRIWVAGDGADISDVKAGVAAGQLLPTAAATLGFTWEDERHSVTASVDIAGAEVRLDERGGGLIAVALRVDPGTRTEVTLTVAAVRCRSTSLDAGPAHRHVDWSGITVHAQDSAVAPTVAAALDDLRHLLLTDPLDERDFFAAAGTPWYLTLFGRDSLWAARMALPFGTELAAGTLNSLARRQGTSVNAERAEAMGKIPHEVRRSAFRDTVNNLALPPVYYGTVDATALWICLLHDAWRWGMPVAQVTALLPNLRAAIDWLTLAAAPDDDGLLKYIDTTGTGLTNQGWKDSGDAVRWRDGRVAEAPIALVEAQAYAVEAATSAAALLDALQQPGADRLRDWAGTLRETVRQRFWVGHGSPDGPWLGIAIDGAGRTVDSITSNMGHVLGTGTLNPDESLRVARTLTSAALLDTYGIRTLAADNVGFNPIGYHTGSIWTHDTAICAWGLSRAGHRAEAARVAQTLLTSAVAFDYHWPELYAGSSGLGRPVPYPASCRPQAWAAASAAVLLSVALGFEADAPAGRLVLRICRPLPFGAMTVHNLKFAGHPFTVQCSADGSATVYGAPSDVQIDVI